MAVALVSLALVAAGCGDDDDEGGGGGGDGGGGGGGSTVSVFGAFVGDEAEAFETALEPFEERTGIDVRYEGTGDFNDLIRIRAQADDLADIVIFPNPGLLTEFAQDGHIVELTGDALASFNDNYSEDWQGYGSVDDAPYGMFIKAAPKSLVWHPNPELEEAGYSVPETWDDLESLGEQIAADGTTPWCIGIEDGESTGWVGTDWMEDIVLRLHGPEVYDQWVNHEIPFDDPRIVEAAELMMDIWGSSDLVRGGTQTILSTAFGDSPRPLFDEPPGCYLHRQASFITTFFPDDVQETLASDDPAAAVFVLPPIGEGAAPVVGGGDAAGMTSDRDAVLQTMAFLGTTEFAEGWAPAGGYIAPHEGFDTSLYPTELERQIGTIVADASSFRFDGSDLMPATVGAGTFWEAIVNMVSGTPPADALAAVEASWPAG
jgi:alpha-glucoside transport system substrate-binding protein